MSPQRFAVAWWDGECWAWVSYVLGGDVATPRYSAHGALGRTYGPAMPASLVRVYVAQRAGCDDTAVSVLPSRPEGLA